jgi:hypothetical protein
VDIVLNAEDVADWLAEEIGMGAVSSGQFGATVTAEGRRTPWLSTTAASVVSDAL